RGSRELVLGRLGLGRRARLLGGLRWRPTRAAAGDERDHDQQEGHDHEADHAGQDDLGRLRRAAADSGELHLRHVEVLGAAAHGTVVDDRWVVVARVVPAEHGVVVGRGDPGRGGDVVVERPHAYATVDRHVGDPDVLRPVLAVVGGVGVVHVVGPVARVVAGV